MGKVLAMSRAGLAALVAGLALAGCGNDRSASGGEAFLAAGRVLSEQVRALRPGGAGGGANGGQPVSRALVADFPDPLLYAQIPARGADGLLGMIARNGDAVTWATPDQITLTLKGGMVVATRGLGDDLMSAQVPDVAALADAGGGRALRRHFHIAGDEGRRREDFRCAIAVTGPETIEVLERRHETLHLTETCADPATPGAPVFVNEHWIEPGGLMRRSRQWLGAAIGHIELQRVVD